MIGWIFRHWPWLALIACLGMLGAAHAFERFVGLEPCLLCLRQREVYWLAIPIALAGLIFSRAGAKWPGLRLTASVIAALAVIFAYGAGLAAYHAGVEWHFWPGPAACAPSTGGVDARAVLEALGSVQKAPSCDAAPWHLFGLSMAGYNALISLKLAVLSTLAAIWHGRHPA